MNKKIILSICFFAISSFSFGQDKDKSKFGYGIGFGFGNSTLENSQFGVLNGNIFSLNFNVDYSFTDKGNTKLISGFDFLDVNSNFYNGINQSKLKNEYMQIPLKIKHKISFDKEDKLNLVVGIGVYANFLLRSNVTTLDGKINTESNGINFGYNYLFGMEYNLSANTSIGITADVMNELNAIKKNGLEQKQTDILLFNIGFSTRF